MAEEESLTWSDVFEKKHHDIIQRFLEKNGGNALLLGKDLVGRGLEKSIIFLWYGHGHLFNPDALTRTRFQPEFDDSKRDDRYKSEVTWGDIKLRIHFAWDHWDAKVFVDDLGEYVRTKGEEVQTSVLLFYGKERKVLTVNIRGKEHKMSTGLATEYRLDRIEGFDCHIMLEEWDFQKCGGTAWHKR